MKNKKGFTMIELLGAITILGIVTVVAVVSVQQVISRSRIEYYKAIEKDIQLAGQSYVQNNRNHLPKKVGKKVEIKLSELQAKKYIGDVKDKNKKDCDNAKTYVQVFKYSKDDYSYVSYLECPDYKSTETINSIKPDIDIDFQKTSASDDSNVNVAKVKITIRGNSEESQTETGQKTKLMGYNYIIYKDGKEVLSSGSIDAGYKDTVTITKNLTKYTPSKITVKVTATNIYGLSASKTKSTNYKDVEPPKCVIDTADDPTKTGGVKNWFDGSRTITIGCDDGDGSGCTRTTYTKTFKDERKTGTIVIEDEAGNKTTCTVSVYIDKTYPTVVMKAYKRTESGGKTGSAIGTVTVDHDTRTGSISDYSNTVNGWLNDAKYPYGIYYEFAYDDAGPNNSGEFATRSWSENAVNLTEANGKDSTLGTPAVTDISGEITESVGQSIVDEGYRKAKYVFTDKAGHSVTINIVAKIDRTAPTMTLTSYKRVDGGGKTGSSVGTVTANNTTRTKSIVNYSNTVSSWLNKANYPYGIHYDFSYSDNLALDYRVWTYNDTGLTIANGKDSALSSGGTEEPLSGLSASDTGSLSASGYRRAKRVVSDEAGNKSTIDIVAQIDVKPPTCTNSGGSTSWTNSSSTTITGTCADTGGSLCVKNVSKTYNTDGTWSSQTPGTVQDNAGNSTACASDRTIKRDTVDPTISWETGAGPHDDSNGITVYTSCSDDRSGVASHTRSSSVGSPTSGTKKTHTCTDNAGNSSSTSRTFKVRKYSEDADCGTKTCSIGSCCGWKSCEAVGCDCKTGRYGCGSVCGTKRVKDGPKSCNNQNGGGAYPQVSLAQCRAGSGNCGGSWTVGCSCHIGPGLTSGGACYCECYRYVTKDQCCTDKSFGCSEYNTCENSACGAKECTKSCCGYYTCWHY